MFCSLLYYYYSSLSLSFLLLFSVCAIFKYSLTWSLYLDKLLFINKIYPISLNFKIIWCLSCMITWNFWLFQSSCFSFLFFFFLSPCFSPFFLSFALFFVHYSTNFYFFFTHYFSCFFLRYFYKNIVSLTDLYIILYYPAVVHHFYTRNFHLIFIFFFFSIKQKYSDKCLPRSETLQNKINHNIKDFK